MPLVRRRIGVGVEAGLGIVELDRGQLTSWPGDYATFVAKKDAWLANEELGRAKFDRFKVLLVVSFTLSDLDERAEPVAE